MCNDFFTYFINENVVLHIWDERWIPIITETDPGYATYSEERLSVRIDLLKPEVYARRDVYENGVPDELILQRGIMFLDSKCLETSLKELLLKACMYFWPDKRDFAIRDVTIAQQGQFLNIYGALFDDSVPSLDAEA